jgi:ABC-2 type transport system permease protein
VRRFIRICWREYARRVFRRRFLLAVASLPIMILVILTAEVVSVLVQNDSRPVGVVDQAGLFHSWQAPSGSNLFSQISFLGFPDEREARQALDAGKIQAYYVIPADYIPSGNLRLVSYQAPSLEMRRAFSDMLRHDLIANQSKDVQSLLMSGAKLEVRSLDGKRQMSETDLLSMLSPLLSGFLFFVVANTSGGYLMNALVEEKENRTMEVLVTSVTPDQLMAGKIVGNLAAGITQLLLWILFPIIGLLAARRVFPSFLHFNPDPQYVWLMVLTVIPAFIFIAALMATLGAVFTDSSEAQQMSILVTLPVVLPMWFFMPISSNPNSPLAVGLSLFPMTAPIALPLRASFSIVPAWQVGLSISLLMLFAALTVWLAGKAFRLGMLRYGKSLSWKELIRKPGGRNG